MSFRNFCAMLAGGAVPACSLLAPMVFGASEAKSPSPPSPAAKAPPPLPTGPSATTTSAPLLTVTGTILSVDLETSRLEVIIGVGLALRALKMSCGEQTEIRASGKGVGLDSLKRGDLVHVSCRPSPEKNLAIRIERMPRPEAEDRAR